MPLLETSLSLPGVRRGKVRDVYPCTLDDGTDALLLIATDRISAFDVVLPQGVPLKGEVLTRISRFWFEHLRRQLGGRLPDHLLDAGLDRVQGLTAEERDGLATRTMVCRPCKPIPVECVVRGYLAGSAWTTYRQHGTVCGVSLPPGLEKGQRLSEPIFTPTTKAETGHDEPISFEEAGASVGVEVMEQLRKWSMRVYAVGHEHAEQRGLLLADTKLEFGTLDDGRICLIDEVLTPDSSRYWPAERHTPGQDQPSFDKQFVRDHLQRLVDDGQWDKQPPGPDLPSGVLAQTAARYHEALDRLVSK